MNMDKHLNRKRPLLSLMGTLWLWLAGNALISLPGMAQTTPTTPPGGATTIPGSAPAVSAVDQQFMIRAAQSDQFEIQSSQLALQRGTSKEVKAYAQRMITEHTNSTKQLTQIAQQRGVTLPKEVGADNKLVLEKLSQLSGAEFDRAYMQAQVKAHSKTQAEFKQYLQQGKDSELRAFANQVLPIVTAHLTMAESMVAKR